MKKFLLFAVLCSVASLSSSAQNNIQFNIHHKLGDVDFELNAGAKNNIDHDFYFKRVEYYISEISIVHDGCWCSTF